MFAFAGPEKMAPMPTPTPEWYRAKELNFETFSLYAINSHNNRQYNHAWGGGLGANYFFTKYLGIGGDAAALYSQNNTAGEFTGKFIARYPIENSRFAPYALVGGGLITDGKTEGFGKAGAGLEYRFTQQLGAKAEYNYNFSNNTNFSEIRVGLGYNF
jgi:opacity protein-like surface antigen